MLTLRVLSQFWNSNDSLAVRIAPIRSTIHEMFNLQEGFRNVARYSFFSCARLT
jgi:hypothetical protein